MINRTEYSSAIKEWPLMFTETRKTALLLCEGKSETDIIELSKTSDIYQLKKEIRRTKLPQKILARLHSLNHEQISLLASGNENIAKLICFLSIMKTDRLLFEFMREVYAEKLGIGQAEISDKDFVIFFERKINESPKVAKWTSNNLEQIKNAYKRILTDAGLGKRQANTLLLTRAICDKDELASLRSGNEIYTEALLLH